MTQTATLTDEKNGIPKLNGAKLRVAILGATGMVGQNFIRLLHDHPYFAIEVLAASPQSAGQTYAAAVHGRWVLGDELPPAIGALPLRDVNQFAEIAAATDLAFCALDLDKDAIRHLEDQYAGQGVWLTSNNSAFRSDPLVPMVIPAVNPHHLEVMQAQRAARGYTTGGIIVKSNCSIQSYVTALEPLREFGLRSIRVHSEQAISGAGKTFATWGAMEGNLIPYIAGEEDKSEREPLKVWGDIGAQGIELLDALTIQARCIRVGVLHGHTAHVTAEFETLPDRETILHKWRNYRRSEHLPSAPQQLIEYTDDPTRPQPALDVMRENGMGITIGHLSLNDVLNTISFTALAHNVILGAAGGAVWATEAALQQGLIYRRIASGMRVAEIN